MADTRLPFLLSSKLDRLQAIASRLTLREAVQMTMRLEEARRRLADLETVPPVLRVLIFGGTGVGKSALFSALVGQGGASPSSDDVRLYTKRPYVAIARDQRALSCVPAELNPEYIDAPWQNVELIDAPDIDGALSAHRALTHRLVEQSDVIIFVTMPDKRANFDIQEEVRAWGSRKRWAFVMNKMDLEDPRAAAIRDDFDARLRDLGFAPDDSTRFLISTKQPARYDFAKLRAMLLDPQQALRAPQFRLDGALGYVEHAVDPVLVDPIAELAQQLRGQEQQLVERVRQLYRTAFADPQVVASFRRAVREQTWGIAGERIGGPMSLGVWLRCRISMLWSVYRLGTGRAFGLTQTLWTALSSAMRGAQPVLEIAAALEKSYRHEMAAIEVQSVRTLEDVGLLVALPHENHSAISTEDEGEDEASLTPLERAAFAPFRAAYRAVNRMVLGASDAQLFEAIRADIDRIARLAARQIASWPMRIVVNVLPVIFLGQVVYRVGRAWYFEEYLHGGFFGMAALLFVASLLPGYVLLAVRVRHKAYKPDVEAMLAEIRDVSQTRLLGQSIRELETIVQDSHQLRKTVRTLRLGLDEELHFATSTPLTPRMPGAATSYDDH